MAPGRRMMVHCLLHRILAHTHSASRSDEWVSVLFRNNRYCIYLIMQHSASNRLNKGTLVTSCVKCIYLLWFSEEDVEQNVKWPSECGWVNTKYKFVICHLFSFGQIELSIILSDVQNFMVVTINHIGWILLETIQLLIYIYIYILLRWFVITYFV